MNLDLITNSARVAFAALLFAVSLTQAADTAVTNPPDAKVQSEITDPEAHEFIRDVLSQQPEKLTVMYGEITVRDENNRRFKVPLKYTVLPEEEGWRGIYETQPTAQRGAERIEITHRRGHSNEYLHFPPGAPGSEPLAPVELNGRQATIPFAASDYWISDLGLEFLHWPEQRLMRDAKITMRHGQACKVIESISPNPEATRYARVVSWLDADTGTLIRAEAYDVARKQMKIFSLHGLTRSEGRVQPKELRMLNTQTDSLSRLELSFQAP